MKELWNASSNGLSSKERIFWMLFFVVSMSAAFFGGYELWDIIHDCAFAVEKFK